MSDHPHCCDHPHAEAAGPVPAAAGDATAKPAGARPMAGAVRFVAWFAGFSGLYAMSAVCPFCGRPGCPAGAASAGVVGLAFAAMSQWGRTLRQALGRAAQRLRG